MRPLPKRTLLKTNATGQLRPINTRLTPAQHGRRYLRMNQRHNRRLDKWSYASGPDTLSGDQDL